MTGITNASPGILSGSISTVMVANGAVTRAKLANDALYSPFAYISGNTLDLTASYLGKTIKTAWGTDLAITVTQANSTNIPEGAEFAIFKWGPSNEVTITFSDTRVCISGETALESGKTVKVTDAFGMIAIKKASVSPTLGDAWLVTGNVEVVE